MDHHVHRKTGEETGCCTHLVEELTDERVLELREKERINIVRETARMVGHDLRNPLQVIVNTVYQARRILESRIPVDKDPSDGEKRLEAMLVTIGQQIKYMNKIVSDLEDYARPLRPEPVKTDIGQLIKDALSAVVLPRNVKVCVEISGDLPDFIIDPVLMKRLLTNLITNALQAMPDGGELTVRTSRTTSTASISITDTGEGIAGENLARLFEPLFTTKSKGQGFGLPVCKRLVEAHKGTITVESEEGKGSTFTVQIPVRTG